LAVGAAYYVWHQKLGKPRSFVMDHAYWDPHIRGKKFAARSRRTAGTKGYSIAELSEEDLSRRAAAIIADGKILGSFQGRAEWVARAWQSQHRCRPAPSGNEGNPQPADQTPRNLSSVCAFHSRGSHREYFEKSHPSPFMTLAYSVRPEKRDKIPAPTHVTDGTAANRHARGQSALSLAHFRLPRSDGRARGAQHFFNDNEPIVCRPEEAMIASCARNGCAGPRRFPHLAPVTLIVQLELTASSQSDEVWQAISHGKQGQRKTRS